MDFEPPLAWITLNRPAKLNILNRSLLEALQEALEESAKRDGIAAIAITGSGDKAFCAGADVEELRSVAPDRVMQHNLLGHRVFEAIERLSKPVLAVVNGYALGGGLELALACDIRIAAEGVRMGLPEVSLGVIPGWGGTWRLAATIGGGRAREMILRGRLIDAAEALEMGLLSRVVPVEDLRDVALELGRDLASKSPDALAMAKGALLAAAPHGEPLSRVESGSVASLVTGEEFQRRLEEFLGDR